MPYNTTHGTNSALQVRGAGAMLKLGIVWSPILGQRGLVCPSANGTLLVEKALSGKRTGLFPGHAFDSLCPRNPSLVSQCRHPLPTTFVDDSLLGGPRLAMS